MNIRLQEVDGRRLICDFPKNGVRGHLTVLLVLSLYTIDFAPGHPYETDPGYKVREEDGKPEHTEGLTAEQLREKLAFYGHDLFMPGDDPGVKPSTYMLPEPRKPSKGPDWRKMNDAEKEEATRMYEKQLKEWNEEKAAKEAAAAQWALDRLAYLKANKVGEPLCENPVTLETLGARNAAETVTRGSRKKAVKASVAMPTPAAQATGTHVCPTPEQDVEIEVQTIETAADLGYTVDKDQQQFGW
jgi:hypothetical protein